MEWFQTTAVVAVIMALLARWGMKKAGKGPGDDWIGEVLAGMLYFCAVVTLVVAGIGWISSW